jgi:ribosome maturation factor RimP
MSMTDEVRDLVLPILSRHDVELYDVEVRGGLVRVVVDRADGVDLGTIGAVTRAVSRALDDADPIANRYTLEVTSPGVERPLRTAEQFARAVGEVVKVRTRPEVEGERRVEGVLLEADGGGITIRVGERTDQDEAERDQPVDRRLAYAEIDRARTVFEWGAPGPKPGHPTGGASKPGSTRKKRERRP